MRKIIKAQAGQVKFETILWVLCIVMVAGAGYLFVNPSLFVQSAFAQFMQANNLFLLAPEFFLTILVVLCTTLAAISRTRKQQLNTWEITAMGLILVLLLLGFQVFTEREVLFHPQWVYGGILTVDLLSTLTRAFLVLGTLISVVTAKEYVNERLEAPGEFYAC